MDKDESLNLESPSETDKLAYTLFKSLDHEHVAAAAITCIAFSPDGTYIAGGADDGQISIWSNSGSLRLLHAISGKSSVLCIKWLDEDRLLGGMEDGVLACINIDKLHNILGALTFSAHIHPISCVDVRPSSSWCATGANGEIRVWKYSTKGTSWTRAFDMPPPARNGQVIDLDVIVTSLYWLESREQLLCSYLNDGVVLWDIGTLSVVSHIVSQVTMSICPPDEVNEQACVAIGNRLSGFDVYSLTSGQPLASFRDKNIVNIVTPQEFLPVLYIHGGLCLLGGGSIGKAYIWEVDSGSPGSVLKVLSHQDEVPITNLAAHYDFEKDLFFIATVQQNKEGPVISIWRTQDPGTPSLQLRSTKPLWSKLEGFSSSMTTAWLSIIQLFGTFLGGLALGLGVYWLAEQSPMYIPSR